MISLITGSPGVGKTMYLFSLLKQDHLQDRPLFAANIKIEGAGEVDNLCRWHEELPNDSVFIVDDADRVFAPWVDLLDGIQAFESCYERGISVYLATQNPGLLHPHLCRCVNLHHHLWSNNLGLHRVTFRHCAHSRTVSDLNLASLHEHVLEIAS